MDTIYGFFYQSWKESSARVMHDKDGQEEFYNTTYGYLKNFMFAVTAGMIAFMPLAFRIFVKAEFKAATVYVPILLMGTYFANISGFYGGIFTANKDNGNLNSLCGCQERQGKTQKIRLGRYVCGYRRKNHLTGRGGLRLFYGTCRRKTLSHAQESRKSEVTFLSARFKIRPERPRKRFRGYKKRTFNRKKGSLLRNSLSGCRP